MAGFLTDDIISSVRGKFDTLHTTFARNIVVYKVSKQEIIISTNPNYNPIYGRTNTGRKVEQETVLSETFSARIYYIDADTEEIDSNQNKVELPKGSVKIVVKSDGYDYIREATEVKFDNNTFSIESDASPYGFVSNQFYVFYLKPKDKN